jgi:Ca2+-binding EF-hand superfamily protein
LKAELGNYEAKNGKLDKSQFKKAIKNLSVSTPDAEIDVLFASSEVEGLLDIKSFLNQVQAAGKVKPLPAQNQQVGKTKI